MCHFCFHLHITEMPVLCRTASKPGKEFPCYDLLWSCKLAEEIDPSHDEWIKIHTYHEQQWGSELGLFSAWPPGSCRLYSTVLFRCPEQSSKLHWRGKISVQEVKSFFCWVPVTLDGLLFPMLSQAQSGQKVLPTRIDNVWKVELKWSYLTRMIVHPKKVRIPGVHQTIKHISSVFWIENKIKRREEQQWLCLSQKIKI